MRIFEKLKKAEQDAAQIIENAQAERDKMLARAKEKLAAEMDIFKKEQMKNWESIYQKEITVAESIKQKKITELNKKLEDEKTIINKKKEKVLHYLYNKLKDMGFEQC